MLVCLGKREIGLQEAGLSQTVEKTRHLTVIPHLNAFQTTAERIHIQGLHDQRQLPGSRVLLAHPNAVPGS